MMTETTVLVAVDGRCAGYITIADTLKDDAEIAIQALHDANIQEVIMLSGDKQAVVQKIATQLGLDKAYGGLLPEDKVHEVEGLKSKGRVVAFVGDGINDAPVIAVADVGIAMGGLGSDAAIETADIVIQTDHPSKIVTAIKIGKGHKTHCLAKHRFGIWRKINSIVTWSWWFSLYVGGRIRRRWGCAVGNF